jgi:nucleoside-diphosphate-sugar epimerase
VEDLVAEESARFSQRRVLITGAAGFIGRRLTTMLVAAGAETCTIESPSADLAPLADLSPKIDQFSLDIQDGAAVRHAVESSRPEYVFHLAAVGVTEPFLSLDLALAVNLHGTINLLRACCECATDDSPLIRLVHTGTPYEYCGEPDERGQGPCPISTYAASKAAAFSIVRMYHRVEGWPIVTVRPFQVYGPGQPAQAFIPAAILAARAGQPFRMTGGEQERDFVYVDDVVRGYLLAAANGRDGHSYDLGWGRTHSLREVVSRLYAVMQVETRPLLGVLPYRPGEVWKLSANSAGATRDLGWSPRVALDEGLALAAKNLLP